MFVIVTCMIVTCVVVVQVMDFNVMIFQRACGRARRKVVVGNIKGTACGCLYGGQRIAFRRFWRGCLILMLILNFYRERG
jgi:hypothetical protein